jgi:asparagine synthase (glutamine-hydrolysing)
LRERVRGALLGERLAATGWFERRSLTRILDEHQSEARDHSPALWSLLMFEAFLRHESGDAPTAHADPRMQDAARDTLAQAAA